MRPLILLLAFLLSISSAHAGFLDDLLSKFNPQPNYSQQKIKKLTYNKSKIKKTYNASHHNASWYNDRGKRTASGIKAHYGVAHKTLPFGTKLLVTNPVNGKSVTATVVDRGPFVRGRDIDINQNTAELLDFRGIGRLLFEVQ